MEWGDFIQGLANKAADVYAGKLQAEQQYDVERLKLQEGLRPQAAAAAGATAGISPAVLLAGAVLVAALVLSK